MLVQKRRYTNVSLYYIGYTSCKRCTGMTWNNCFSYSNCFHWQTGPDPTAPQHAANLMWMLTNARTWGPGHAPSSVNFHQLPNQMNHALLLELTNISIKCFWMLLFNSTICDSGKDTCKPSIVEDTATPSPQYNALSKGNPDKKFHVTSVQQMVQNQTAARLAKT